MAWFTASSTQILVSIIINLPSCQALYASCPPGWLKWQQSCYILLPDKMNWFEASEACNRPGSSLAVPNSREENDFIWKSVRPQTSGMWIGCTDAAQEGIWLCGGQPLSFPNWNPGNPHTDNQRNCARMTVNRGGGSWSDSVPCGSRNRKHAACEMTVSAMPAYHIFTGPDGRVSQRQPMTFPNWNPGNPHTDNQLNCARMTTHFGGGLWSDDVPCGSSKRKHAACEMTVSAMPVYHTYTGPDGRVSQRCLLNHDIKKLAAEGLLACGWACRADPRCRSFNLWQISKREKMCQLNDVTRFGADCNDFKAIDKCYYFDL
ncbi:uncharacterized protein LOC119736828 [Patiria miniata]|uniref:C-type lectin domain-containing protein n=1 Tax=Patiria miniata TaxID=46514 RepID=A0A914ART5_PATMI|nr:uncharacterized protein LOC119736828 [Patiria miniata]